MNFSYYFSTWNRLVNLPQCLIVFNNEIMSYFYISEVTFELMMFFMLLQGRL